MGLKKLAAIAGGLALWYTFTGAPSNYPPATQRYPLPKEIKIISTTLPYETRKTVRTATTQDGQQKEIIALEKIVKPDQIDFSQNFEIKTERYHLVKDEDWLPSRLIGHTVAMINRLFFWDWNISWGLDGEKTRAVLAMLENKKSLQGLTVRINHNEAMYDWYRMMTESELRQRNPFLYRAIIGTWATIADELWAELSRGDYYHPLTKTVVVYSNVESVAAHELGHHVDYSRFSTDWLYNFTSILFPPIRLYKEWQASSNAVGIMSSADSWQFYRYLLPAFFTYILGTWAVLKRWGKRFVGGED